MKTKIYSLTSGVGHESEKLYEERFECIHPDLEHK